MAAEHAVTSALATSLPHSVGPEAAAKPPRAPLRMRHPDMTNMPDSSDSDHDASDSEGETTAVDDGTYNDDNYVRKVLAKEKPLPPITLGNLYKNINVISTLALTVVPALAIYGAFTTPVMWQTALWAVAYYFYTGLGEFRLPRRDRVGAPRADLFSPPRRYYGRLPPLVRSA